MRQVQKWIALGVLAQAGLLLAQPEDARAKYEVKVTNLTRGLRLTPVLVVGHASAVRLFDLGAAASAELKALAEEGDVMPFTTLLRGRTGVCEVTNSPAPPPVNRLIAPGATITVTVEAGAECDRISAAAMLIPTNDAFVAANSAMLPARGQVITIMSPAYDAGTERNDEMCASIPGPGFMECITPENPEGNGGGAAPGMGEGFVHVHAGIHGGGNLNAAMRDWRNPAVRFEIRRIN